MLQGATGLFRPGELCAIMGPSGAGKSSCLDILAGQDKRGTVGGRAYFALPDGRTVPAAESRRHLCRFFPCLLFGTILLAAAGCSWMMGTRLERGEPTTTGDDLPTKTTPTEGAKA